MTRDEAIVIIREGLSFNTDSNLTSRIVERMKAAQRDFEKGKTLPSFLIQEDETLSLLSGTHTVALPTGFLRIADDTLRYQPTTSDIPLFIPRRDWISAHQVYAESEDGGPKAYAIRKDTIYFWPEADRDYELTWSYYKADDVLDSNIENLWLTYASDWLIGEAGYRTAKILRDTNAAADFDEMRKVGRAAILAEQFAAEQADQDTYLGADF